jgi:hypothetical protein
MNANKKLKKEAKECRRQLGGVLIVIGRLEKKRVKLGIASPEIIFWLELLRDRARLLKSAAQQIEQLPEVTAS